MTRHLHQRKMDSPDPFTLSEELFARNAHVQTWLNGIGGNQAAEDRAIAAYHRVLDEGGTEGEAREEYKKILKK